MGPGAYCLVSQNSRYPSVNDSFSINMHNTVLKDPEKIDSYPYVFKQPGWPFFPRQKNVSLLFRVFVAEHLDSLLLSLPALVTLYFSVTAKGG